MKFKDFIEKTKKVGGGTEIWISNPTFNELMEKTEKIRINESGYLELQYDKIRVQVSMSDGKLYKDDIFYYAKVVEISEHDNYTGFKRNVIFMLPKNPECAKIL